MKGFVAALLIVIGIVVLVLSLWRLGVYNNYTYPKEYGYALQLADDASLPGQKAEYLKEYLSKVETITGKPAYIFMTPDMELSRQRIILKGLIERFEALSTMDPSNMAYQQGMYQLSGQEINHQLERVAYIYKAAKIRESFPLFFTMYWGWLVGVILIIIGGCIASEF